MDSPTGEVPGIAKAIDKAIKEAKRLEFARTHKEKRPPHHIARTAQIDLMAVIGADGFGYARDTDRELVKINHAGNVIIEDFVEIRAFATIDRGTVASTIIGYGTKIDHHVHIAHNVQVGKFNTFANGCSIEGSVCIGDYNTFGSMVTVQRKVKIGSNCIFGSGTVVTKDVPDNSVVVGNPGRIIGSL